MSFVPRRDRPILMARNAAAAARAGGASAMQAAFAAIDGGFGEAAVINSRKIEVDKMLLLGPASTWLRAYYGSIAMDLPDDLGGAIRALRGAIWKGEQKNRLLIRDGHSPRRLSRVREALITLRWLRRHGYAPQWPAILEAATTPAHYPITFSIAEANSGRAAARAAALEAAE